MGPVNRWTYRNIDKVLTVAPISKGSGPAYDFPNKRQDLSDISFERTNGTLISLGSHLKNSFTDGFLVLHDGKVITEAYFDGMSSDSLHLSQSVCKSVVGTLAGILIQFGFLDEGELVTDYVPALKNSGYAKATVRHLLDMRTGVYYGEDYDNPSREYQLMDQCAGWKDKSYSDAPKSYHDFLASIQSDGGHGGKFQYRSIDTDVLGWVCECAAGEALPNLISKYIWQKIGADHDASLVISPEGASIANGGLNASLRDYAKFGALVLNEGTFNGQDIVGKSWIKESVDGDHAAFATGYPFYHEEFPDAAYSNQWWVLDREQKIHSAIGIHGQFIYIDHQRKVVIVKLSTWPTAANEALEFDDLRMMKAVALHLDS